MQMFYVYIIKKISDDSLYIGYTENLHKRFKQHQQKFKIRLLYYEAYTSEEIARERERKLKHYGSAWRSLKQRIGA